MSEDEVINPAARPLMRQCPCRQTIYFKGKGEEVVICSNCKRKHIVRFAGGGYTCYWEEPDPGEAADGD